MLMPDRILNDYLCLSFSEQTSPNNIFSTSSLGPPVTTRNLSSPFTFVRMPHDKRNEQIAQDKKRQSDKVEKQDQTPQERSQPWKTIIPIVEAQKDETMDAREMFKCNQGFYGNSLAA